jgi:N-acetylmuramoyl-L-alanine amidase
MLRTLTIAALAAACSGTAAPVAGRLSQPSVHVAPSGNASDAAAGMLAGRVIGIDPGHNGRNYTDPTYIDRQVWNGRENEDCDTTGTSTDGGYTEALFNYRVAMFLAADLRGDGAQVVMTRHSNNGVGPCITRRAHIINAAHADVAIDIHADGGPASGRGFTVLEPVRDSENAAIVKPSAVFARAIRREILAMTHMPISTYDGVDGITHRDDLAGLNLATEPKVLVEAGNMRNAQDARMLTSTVFQRRLAAAFATAIVDYLRS